MYIDRMLRLIAGFFVMLSVAMAHLHSINWLWFTALSVSIFFNRPLPIGAR